MRGSINFLFHLIGFGLIFTALLGGWIIERRIRTEKDWNQKLYIGKISRRFGLLSPIASVVMLLTGIVNIFNLYNGNINLWYTEGWLIAKIILFAFLLINGAVFGPILIRRRTKLVQGIAEKATSEDAESTIIILSKSISTFYLVQFLLLIIILYLSVAGGGKHPGII
jgi:putative copper export protein